MKQSISLGIVIVILVIAACRRDDTHSDRFILLTGIVWQSDSLLMNGVPAGGDGQPLEAFNGTVDFRADGTGSFGQHTGTWRFAQNETQLVIESTLLPFPLTTQIVELTSQSLKITASLPNITDPQSPSQIRMTFKPQ